jgi:hypothetical protein
MSHLAMLENLPGGADPTTWLEPVTDEQYQTANQQGDLWTAVADTPAA